MPPIFEYVTFISAPATKVWQAITDPDVVNQYYLVPLIEIELKVGGVIAYGPPGEAMIQGEIVALETETKLAHTFAFAHQPDEPASRVTYALEATGDVTQLVLTHDEFAEDSGTYNDVCGGWPVILSELKTLLETGKKLPWPQPEG